MAAPEPHDILRLHRCPKCGYDLTGLPREGRCPECGSGYDAFMFCLQGRRRGTLFGWRLILLLLSCFVIYGVVFGQWIIAIGVLVIIVALIFAIDRQILNWFKGNSERLHITNDGVALRNAEGEALAVSWAQFSSFRMYRLQGIKRRPRGVGLWEIRLYRRSKQLLPKLERGDEAATEVSEGDMVFRIDATESEATRIVDRLRECFTRDLDSKPPS